MTGTSTALGDQAGFTLIEVLVATAMSIVLMLALTAILTTTSDQTERTFTQIDATRQARAAIATIDNDLHSACVVAAAAPVQAGSTANTLDFVSYTGGAATPGESSTTPGAPSPNPILYHTLSLQAGALTDTTYIADAADGAWTPGAKQNTVTLLAHATAQSGVDPFQYYSYQSYPAPDGNNYWTIPDGVDSLPTGVVPPQEGELSTASPTLTNDQAQNTVEVVINLEAEAAGQSPGDPDLTSTADPVTDAISLRLTTPPDEVAATAGQGDYGPCQ